MIRKLIGGRQFLPVWSMLGTLAGVFWIPACDGNGLRLGRDGASIPDRARDDGSGDEQVCVIGSSTYPSGTVNPQNACQSCQPDRSASEWSDISPGPGCLSLAQRHSCAVVNGSVWCWGFNDSGVLGNGTYASSATPVRVQGLKPGVQAIAPAFGRGFALVQGGVQGWGSAPLGNGSSEDSLVPVPVSNLQSGVQAVSPGLTFTCALSKGDVWCWGRSQWQLFGNSTKKCQEQASPLGIECLVPVKIEGLPANVRAIAAGSDHMCALADDSVWCWGSNSLHQVSPEDPSVTFAVGIPRRIEGLPPGLQTLVAGYDRTCVLADGNVTCWGRYRDTAADIDAGGAPTLVSGLPSAVRGLAVGGGHICAMLEDGVMCRGNNITGQLGNNARGESAIPVRVQGLPLPVRAIAAGHTHTCALVADGIWCWGGNAEGELGNGSKTDSLVPVRVQGIPGL